MEMAANEHAVPCASLAVLEERVQGLEEWQKRQNGTLGHLAAQVDKLYLWIIGILVTSFATLATVLLTHVLSK